MGLCNCRSKFYGSKTAWITETEAEAACEEYKQTNRNSDPDWRLMNSYPCPEGNGFHIGHSRRQTPAATPKLQVESPKVRATLGEIVAHDATSQRGVPILRAAQDKRNARPLPITANTHEGKDKEVLDLIKQFAYVGIGLGVKVAESIALATVEATKQAKPAVQRGSNALLQWAISGLKGGADYLDDVQKKLQQKREK